MNHRFRKMKVIFISSRKGGCGKSTITINLASYFVNSGHKVAVLDLDPQRSLVYWASLRTEQIPLVKRCSPKDWLMESAELEEEGFDLLLIDSPPVAKDWVQALMRHVDLIVIPTRPSPLDIYSATFSNEWAKGSEADTRWVINGAHPSSQLPSTIRESLSEMAQVFDTVIHQRTDIAISVGNGQSVLEFAPNSRSAEEFTALGTEVSKLLKLKSKKPRK